MGGSLHLSLGPVRGSQEDHALSLDYLPRRDLPTGPLRDLLSQVTPLHLGAPGGNVPRELRLTEVFRPFHVNQHSQWSTWSMPKRGSAKTHLWGIGGTTVQWGHLGSYCRGELGVWRGTRVRRWGAGRLQRASREGPWGPLHTCRLEWWAMNCSHPWHTLSFSLFFWLQFCPFPLLSPDLEQKPIFWFYLVFIGKWSCPSPGQLRWLPHRKWVSSHGLSELKIETSDAVRGRER